MEFNSERDKSELSSNDSESFHYKTVKLGSRKIRHFKSMSSSCEKSPLLESDLLSSISKNLQIHNIQVYSKKNSLRFSDPYTDRDQVAISCFPIMPPLSNFLTPSRNHVEYNSLLKTKDRSSRSIIEDVHKIKGQRLGCQQQNCAIKRRWMKNIIFYQRQLKNVLILRQKIGECSQQARDQIQKDVGRSFPNNVITKSKINVSQSMSQKHNLVDNLRTILRLYSIFDPQVGYVQGMNLIGAAIVMHMKEVNASFIYFKQVMRYGKLRQFYLGNFEYLKQQLTSLLNIKLKRINPELHLYLSQRNINSVFFVPYYLTLFASFIDINYMHIVINQFMRQGIRFLNKLMVVLLLYLKPTLLDEQEQQNPVMKLGNSYLKQMGINWQELLECAERLDLE